MTPRPAPKSFGIGGILPLAALLLAGSAVTVAALSSFGVFPSFAAAGESLPPTAPELGAALARVGLTAETLTAAGVQEAGAAQAVADARAYLNAERFSALAAAAEDWKSAAEHAERLGKLVRAGQASGPDLSAYTTAKSDLATAAAARDGLLDDLLEAATASLQAGQTQTLARVHANQANGLATAYRVTDRAEADAVALRDALANLRTAARVGEDPDSAASQLVTQANGDPDTAAAQSHLESRLTEVQLAFEEALEG